MAGPYKMRDMTQLSCGLLIQQVRPLIPLPMCVRNQDGLDGVFDFLDTGQPICKS